MRLLENSDYGEVRLTKNFVVDIPRYAILSHTWGTDEEEVTFKDMIDGIGKSKAGYKKIRFCGEQAERDGIQYFWVDTCCIDKSNNSELTEAINSMFRWYSDAEKCYVYLSDVSSSTTSDNDHNSHQPSWESAFRRSKWFTRGWTLQELIAPISVEFFSIEWEKLGDKTSLKQYIHEITGISVKALERVSLSDFTVDERFSWAEKRMTTRIEDNAYSLLGSRVTRKVAHTIYFPIKILLGIFEIYMTLIYGEGRENALRRLRKKIDKALKNSVNSNRAPYQTRLLKIDSTFAQEDNGYWQLIDATGDGKPDLVYIKNKNTGSGYVEIHIASSYSDFQTLILEVATTFVEEDNGTWRLFKSSNSALPDLIYIKTQDTPSGKVEVHIASGASMYTSRSLEVVTSFENEKKQNGKWSVYDYNGDGKPDLVFIKPRNTGTGTTEVFVASGFSNYQERLISTGTIFPIEDGNNGFWQLGPYSINGDLIHIKDANTGTGTIEVHIASRASGWQTKLLGVGSNYAEEQDGCWQLVDFSADGKLDLTYIKYLNTESGTVEVHVTSGWFPKDLSR
ncbi:uncharacterized protein EAE98_000727 [Botrytis deweyae]|uniref:Heterokaryon incompatibility domain-containing protein n=1 Tax=Botrytis deweyae TaxID=2478750 RepID=A0ABQ7J3I8_9HELO|nr:uncharacterized protein EAE98_000727 [Botrytis deweyae]KAF7940600.1 hypothetical protein EAE98_000727 [Botrytis deweyae]